MKEDRFVNLDDWVPKTILPNYQKEILSKLLVKKPEEQKRDDRRVNPMSIGGGPGSAPRVP